MNKYVPALIVLAAFLCLSPAIANAKCVNYVERSAAIVEFIEGYIADHPELTQGQVAWFRVAQGMHQRTADGKDRLPWHDSLNRLMEQQYEDLFWWWEVMDFHEGMRQFSCKNFRKPCDPEIDDVAPVEPSED